jgi:hypothetical protein
MQFSRSFAAEFGGEPPLALLLCICVCAIRPRLFAFAVKMTREIEEWSRVRGELELPGNFRVWLTADIMHIESGSYPVFVTLFLSVVNPPLALLPQALGTGNVSDSALHHAPCIQNSWRASWSELVCRKLGGRNRPNIL